MMQAKTLITAAILGTVGLMMGAAAQAEDFLANYRTPAPPAAATEAMSSELSESPEPAAEADEVAEAEILECPPGQFPSAFADVYPFHWAYQAINNLASPNMECFDLPEEYR